MSVQQNSANLPDITTLGSVNCKRALHNFIGLILENNKYADEHWLFFLCQEILHNSRESENIFKIEDMQNEDMQSDFTIHDKTVNLVMNINKHNEWERLHFKAIHDSHNRQVWYCREKGGIIGVRVMLLQLTSVLLTTDFTDSLKKKMEHQLYRTFRAKDRCFLVNKYPAIDSVLKINYINDKKESWPSIIASVYGLNVDIIRNIGVTERTEMNSIRKRAKEDKFREILRDKFSDRRPQLNDFLQNSDNGQPLAQNHQFANEVHQVILEHEYRGAAGGHLARAAGGGAAGGHVGGAAGGHAAGGHLARAAGGGAAGGHAAGGHLARAAGGGAAGGHAAGGHAAGGHVGGAAGGHAAHTVSDGNFIPDVSKWIVLTKGGLHSKTIPFNEKTVICKYDHGSIVCADGTVNIEGNTWIKLHKENTYLQTDHKVNDTLLMHRVITDHANTQWIDSKISELFKGRIKCMDAPLMTAEFVCDPHPETCIYSVVCSIQINKTVWLKLNGQTSSYIYCNNEVKNRLKMMSFTPDHSYWHILANEIKIKQFPLDAFKDKLTIQKGRAILRSTSIVRVANDPCVWIQIGYKEYTKICDANRHRFIMKQINYFSPEFLLIGTKPVNLEKWSTCGVNRSYEAQPRLIEVQPGLNEPLVPFSTLIKTEYVPGNEEYFFIRYLDNDMRKICILSFIKTWENTEITQVFKILEEDANKFKVCNNYKVSWYRCPYNALPEEDFNRNLSDEDFNRNLFFHPLNRDLNRVEYEKNGVTRWKVANGFIIVEKMNNHNYMRYFELRQHNYGDINKEQFDNVKETRPMQPDFCDISKMTMQDNIRRFKIKTSWNFDSKYMFSIKYNSVNFCNWTDDHINFLVPEIPQMGTNHRRYLYSKCIEAWDKDIVLDLHPLVALGNFKLEQTKQRLYFQHDINITKYQNPTTDLEQFQYDQYMIQNSLFQSDEQIDEVIPPDILFHGTTLDKIVKIMQQMKPNCTHNSGGLAVQIGSNIANGAAWGPGIYLTPSTTLASTYAMKKGRNNGAVVYCAVKVPPWRAVFNVGLIQETKTRLDFVQQWSFQNVPEFTQKYMISWSGLYTQDINLKPELICKNADDVSIIGIQPLNPQYFEDYMKSNKINVTKNDDGLYAPCFNTETGLTNFQTIVVPE
jgi:hypothetical protein